MPSAVPSIERRAFREAKYRELDRELPTASECRSPVAPERGVHSHKDHDESDDHRYADHT